MTSHPGSRVPCVIEIDLRRSRRGLASTIREDLGGRSVLARTVAAVRACEHVAAPVIAVHEREADAARAAFDELGCSWFVHTHDDIAQRDRLRRARRWGKDGWRGGLVDSYFFCEAGNPHVLEELCQQRDWDDVMVVPAEAAFADPEQLDAIAGYYLRERRGVAAYLSTAPPGIAGDIVSRRLVETAADAGVTLDRIYPFVLDDPASDIDQNRVFHHFDEDVTTQRGRFTIDSRDALGRGREWARLGATDCRELFRRVNTTPSLAAGPRPEEIIVELTSDADGAWAPRPGRSPGRRASLEPGAWREILASLAAGDESLLTLGGGYADPFLDATLAGRIGEAREAGALGIHVETTGANLDDVMARSVVAAEPDAITVDLTATRSELLGELRPGTPPFEARVRGLERLIAARDAFDGRAPFILVSVLLEQRGVAALEAFVERWFAKTDRVLIRGIESATGGAVPESLGCFAPPTRFGCARLDRQLRVEVDGSVPLCSRDPEQAVAVGRLGPTSVEALWTSGVLARARDLHRERRWDELHHCGSCQSWFRFD